MFHLRFPSFAASFAAAALIASALPGFAANASSQQAMVPSIAEPGASQQWCGSLPYPYCRDPAPGTPNSGPIYTRSRFEPRPLFGN